MAHDWKHFPQTRSWPCAFCTPFSPPWPTPALGAVGPIRITIQPRPDPHITLRGSAHRSVAGSHSCSSMASTTRRGDWGPYRYIPLNPRQMYPKCILPSARCPSCPNHNSTHKAHATWREVLQRSQSGQTGPNSPNWVALKYLTFENFIKTGPHSSAFLGPWKEPTGWGVPFVSWNAIYSYMHVCVHVHT